MAIENEQQEREALQKLVELCQKDNLLERPRDLAPEDSIEGLVDESALLRFLRGRVNDVSTAFPQFKEAQQTREQLNANATYNNIDVSDFEGSRSIYPHWMGHRSKAGLPLCMFDIGHVAGSTLASYKKSCEVAPADGGKPLTALQRGFAFHDGFVRFTLPLCSALRNRPNPDIPVLGAIYLADASSFGLKQAWDLRAYAQEISQLLAISFPEVVETVYVLNAPAYFSRIWSVLKSWVNPRTASKLVVVPRGEVLAVLSERIETSAIPVRFGGELEFEHGDLPRLDAATREALEWVVESEARLPPGPLKWGITPEGRRAVIAVGTVDGKERRVHIASLRQVPDAGDVLDEKRSSVVEASERAAIGPVEGSVA